MWIKAYPLPLQMSKYISHLPALKAEMLSLALTSEIEYYTLNNPTKL